MQRISFRTRRFPKAMGVMNPIVVVAVLVFCGLARADPPEDGCEEIMLPMCRGAVPYNYTRLEPNRNQAQIYRLLERTRRVMDNSSDTVCSSLYRELACRMLLPKCTNGTQEMPCRQDCKSIKKRCEDVFNSFSLTWPGELECRRLVKKPKKSRGGRRGGRRGRGRGGRGRGRTSRSRSRGRSRGGRRRNRHRVATVAPSGADLEVGAVSATRNAVRNRMVQSSNTPVCKVMPREVPRVIDPNNTTELYCQPNEISICEGLGLNLGTLPNSFHQADVTQITNEISVYQDLIDSGCHDKFRLFLCSTYKPLCVDETGYRYFILPCRELCQQIEADCRADYNQLFPGWVWPIKFQCHTFWPKEYNITCLTGIDEEDATILS